MINFKGLVFSNDFESKTKKNFAQAQNYVDNEVLKYLPDYTPMSRVGGYTKKSPHKWVKFQNRGNMSRAHKVERPGLIINTEPKAREQYYTNKQSGIRGKYWLERMKADHKDDILKGLNKK
ncbi:hypothetical protein [Ruminococcus flavefaciens]|uniref:hypothetical protein n=1 Tax=Ruminococcus flavefaciens TaxID=1265 RepID=UPI0026EC7B0D|nr:hypothetical protein [Ruminococcus flavefaciens]